MIHFDKHLLSRDQHFYLGFSGGNDSLGASVFLKQGNYNFTLLHVEHFDTPASVAISEGVQQLAPKLGLPLLVLRCKDSADASIAELAKAKPDENTAHNIRQKLFNGIESKVVLAHTANDLAETYFQNCLQGRGEHTPLFASNGNIIRPFLRTRRRSLSYLLETRGLIDAIIPDTMANQRAILRSVVFPAIGTDLVTTTQRLFVSTRKIYKDS